MAGRPLCSALLALLALASGCAPAQRPSCPVSGELNACTPSIPATEIRILTVNAWTGLDYKGLVRMGRYRDDDPERRYRMLVSGIRGLDPDIVAVQEANPLPDFADRLSADLGYHAVYHVSNCGLRFGPAGFPVNLRQGEVILVKEPWTLIDLGARKLSGSGFSSNWFCMQFREIRKAALARAEIGGRPLYIYGVHLHSGPFYGPALDRALARLRRETAPENVAEAVKGAEKDIAKRRREVAGLKEFMDETLPEGAPAILLGCFNTDTESGDLDPLTLGGAWLDTYRLSNPPENPSGEGCTWDPEHNPNFHPAGPGNFCDLLCAYQEERPLRLDFIFINKEFPPESVIESRVVFKPVSGMAPSDHYAVMTRVRW